MDECNREDTNIWIISAAVITGVLVLVGCIGVGECRYFDCEGTSKPAGVGWLEFENI